MKSIEILADKIKDKKSLKDFERVRDGALDEGMK